MEFKIPVRREDLLHSSFVGQYTVQEVLSAREIIRKKGECRTDLQEQGATLILEYFDYFYSCISEHCNLENSVRSGAWNILTDAFCMFLNDLTLNLDEDSLDSEDRLRLLNMLKMFSFLICHWMPLFEEESNLQDTLVSKRGKAKKKTTKDDNGQWNWIQEQCKIIELLDALSKTSLQKLWDQNQMEDEFLNLLINCCFKFLENQQLCKIRECKELVFHILGRLFKNQKHSIGHAVKIVQLLQLFEHLSMTLAQAVVIFVNSYKMNQLLSDVIREIGNASAQDTLQNNLGNRAFSVFLAEIAKQMPNLVLPNISYLAIHLDGESYCMRNCVLSIMSEILLHSANADGENEPSDRVRSLREQFLDHLEDHIHDVNAFVRSKCLQIWTQLCESQTIPILRQQRLLELIVDRLQDKSCSVRKCAVRFLTSILQNNPFAAKISLNELQDSFDKETAKLQDMLNEINLNDKRDEVKTITEQENDQSTPDEDNDPVDISKQKVLIKYLKDSSIFAKAVSKALPLVSHLLYSSQVTDVMEAISFFVTAFKFGVHNSIIGIQKMLTLVWSTEAELKNAVMTAYKSLYLHSDKANGGNNKKDIAGNLIRLTMNATIGEIASLELLIHDLVKSGDVDESIIDALWKRFYFQMKHSKTESHAAIILIGMASSAQKEIIEQKLNIIDEMGLGARASKDFFYARDVFGALLKLGTKLTTDGTKTTFNLPYDHIIFKHISEIVVGGIKSFNDNSWVSMSQQAVDFIYKISDKPDIICGNILINIVELIKNPASTENDQFLDNVPSKLLANVLLLSSHVALCQMLYLEITVFNELKRRRQINEEKTINSVKKQKRKSKNARESIMESVCETNGEDHGLNSAIAEDIDAEFIRKVCDKELLSGNEKILSIMARIAVKVASDPIKYSNKYLKTASNFALAKFMMVSQDFCETNTQLLFTVLEKSELPSIRATLMIAACDLACRFPNIIEPWTSHIFKRVRDESFEVRENSIAVLGHLLFNDMIKVKGSASEIALCIVDEDLRIQKKAKQLFTDLSQKNNAVFNLMPDIIGRLIDAEVGTTEENFQTIMKFLLEFVKKDRLLESLVEKICHRFALVRLEWQWRCLAFSLTLLCENEKSCRKLLENISVFQESIAEELVYSFLNAIIINARKTFKEEFQPLVDELEEQLDLIHNKALGEDGVEKHIDRVPVKRNKVKVRRNVKERNYIRKSEEGSPEVDKKMRTRSRKNHKNPPALVFSSDDDFD